MKISKEARKIHINNKNLQKTSKINNNNNNKNH